MDEIVYITKDKYLQYADDMVKDENVVEYEIFGRSLYFTTEKQMERFIEKYDLQENGIDSIENYFSEPICEGDITDLICDTEEPELPNGEWIRNYDAEKYLLDKLQNHFSELVQSNDRQRLLDRWKEEAREHQYTNYVLEQLKSFQKNKIRYPVNWDKIKDTVNQF